MSEELIALCVVSFFLAVSVFRVTLDSTRVDRAIRMVKKRQEAAKYKKGGL